MGGGHSPLGHPPCIHPRAPAPSASPGNSSATRPTKPHPGPPELRPLGVGLSSETLDELFGRFPSGLEVRKLHLGPPSRPPPCTRRCSDRHHGPGPRRDTRPRSLMTLTALALRTSLLGTHGAAGASANTTFRDGRGQAVPSPGPWLLRLRPTRPRHATQLGCSGARRRFPSLLMSGNPFSLRVGGKLSPKGEDMGPTSLYLTAGSRGQ